jgi:GNAT superfamily N-acetyltransferase
VEVVAASLSDAARLTRFLCDQMYPEMDLGFAPLDESEALNTVARLTDHGRVFMLVDGGSLVGAVGLEAGRRFWWSKAEALGDFFFYIAPSHRRWGAHRALANAAKNAARQAGLPLILGGFGSPRLSLLNRLFRLLGFQEIGSLYLWR